MARSKDPLTASTVDARVKLGHDGKTDEIIRAHPAHPCSSVLPLALSPHTDVNRKSQSSPYSSQGNLPSAT